MNLKPSIGLSTGGHGPIITLGGRLQIMRTRLVNIGDEDEMPTNWMNDYLYGIFVAVMFSF